MSMNEQEQDGRPDYEVAKDELRAWWEQSGLVAEVSTPRGVVRDGHAMIEYSVSFASLAHVTPTRLEYRMGVGHVDWKKADREIHSATGWQRYGLSPHRGDAQAFINTMIQGHTPKDQATLAPIAALIAKAQKVQPSPVEVLAACAQDGTALYQTFEEWAGDLGYDLDSRKAEATWRACCDAGRSVIALVGKETAEKLAELASRL